MDLSILQKVNELKDEGRPLEDIKRELITQGIAPEIVEQALREVGVGQPQAQPAQAQSMPTGHHEKVIQPSPGFDPNAK